ncbi:hypothetical protein Dimus_035079 [Dionaea muscipula]
MMLGMSRGAISSAAEQEMGESRTLLDLLKERMDGEDGRIGAARWKGIKERLRLRRIGFCGAMWWPTYCLPTASSPGSPSDQDDVVERPMVPVVPAAGSVVTNPDCVNQAPPAAAPMNLAAALAAERQFRPTVPAEDDGDGGGGSVRAPSTPLRVSLIRLLAETMDGEDEEREGKGGAGFDNVCCVCMERKKGTAYIPCGHTFCRVCSRELWLTRHACSICNRPILGILNIF